MPSLEELIETQAQVVAEQQQHFLSVSGKAPELSTPGHPYWDALKVQSNALASSIDKYATLVTLGRPNKTYSDILAERAQERGTCPS